jgi:hypothetical protein
MGPTLTSGHSHCLHPQGVGKEWREAHCGKGLGILGAPVHATASGLQETDIGVWQWDGESKAL